MKKLFLSMLAAVTLFASCSQEEIVTKTEGESLVSFTVTTPELGSRAVGDGTTATDLYFVVYDETLGEQVETISSKTPYDKFKNKTATIHLPLLNGHQYSLLFWAEAPNKAGAYGINWETKSINLKNASALVSNNENYDAFYAYVEPFTVTGTKTSSVELKRPFAQLNIGTTATDMENVKKYYNAEFAQSTIVVTTAASMDLTTGKVSGEKELTYAAANFITTEKMKETYEYLSMNYLLVSNEKNLVDVKFSVSEDKENGKVISKTFNNVPVQRNYKTNIYGDLFTSSTTWNVELKPGFQTPDNDLVTYAVSTEAELKKATATGAIVTLTNDIELTSALTFANNVEINGQGFAIKGYPVTFTGKAVSIRNAKFVGADNANDDASNIYVATGNEKFIVENCEFSGSQWDAIQYTAENATNVTINNCVFKAENQVARAIHLQVKSESAAQVVITNNKIFNGNNYNENKDTDIVCVYGFAKANMTLEGNVVYDVDALDNVLIWISDGMSDKLVGTNGFSVGGASASTTDTFETALANGDVTLAGDVTTVEKATLAAGSTLDGGNNTLSVGGENLSAYFVPAGTSGTLRFIETVGNATIKNITVDGNDAEHNGYGIRGIFLTGTGTVTIDNVTIKNVTYCLNDDAAEKTLNVSNSTFEGWTSYNDKTIATFTNTKFQKGTYGTLRPYAKTTFVDCDFAEGFVVDVYHYSTDNKGNITKEYQPTIVFKNCTYAGQKLTSTSALFEADDINEGKMGNVTIIQ